MNVSPGSADPRRPRRPRPALARHAARMTMTEPVVPETVASNASALADEQWRVAVLVAALGPRGRWGATLAHDAPWRLARRGHLPPYAGELDWTPRVGV